MTKETLSEIIECWACNRELSLRELSINDGDCIFCGEEIDLTIEPYSKEEPNHFIYHYCISFQYLEERSDVSHAMDGVVRHKDSTVKTYGDYDALKRRILTLRDVDIAKVTNITIQSLSFLGRDPALEALDKKERP